MMQTFLMAADEEQSKNQVVKTWVKQVRDLAYHVEDCIQLFAVHLEKPSKWRLPCTVQARHQIAAEIKELKARVEDVSQRNLRYRLIIKDDSATSKTATASLATLGLDEASWRAARQDNPQDDSPVDLIQLICSSDTTLRVVSVWGTSDLGRMSVVRESYNDPKTTQNFKCRAWVDKLMQPFNPNEFLKSLVRQFHANSLQVLSESTEKDIIGIKIMKMEEMMADAELIREEFARHVNENRYLIVIDNLSALQEWDWIKTYLPDRKNGSRVIVSTQHVEIASLCVEQPNQVMVSQLNKLSYDQPLHLFFNKDTVACGPEVVRRSVSKAGANAADSQHFASGSNTATNRETTGPRQLARTSTLAACLEEAQLIGRDKEKATLVRQISEDDQQRRVISVWGMGGIGKTSLVREVYNSAELSSQRFQCRAWVTVLHPFDPKEFLRALLKQLDSNSSGKKDSILGGTVDGRLQSMGLDRLVSESDKRLKEKTYLIVLDDLSSIEEWDWIKLHFHDKNASRIIVTTREENVAIHCSMERKLANIVGPLPHDEALRIFCKKVYSKETKYVEMSADMAEQAELILKRCGGLPLAVTTIGGFLASRPKSTVEWKKLHDHISVEMENNSSLEPIKAVLSSSYAGLPYHLKSFFLYLGIFPEDCSIRRKKLVRRWIAEGYLRNMRGMDTEEIAEVYFSELISRSMIQASKFVPTTNGIPKFCRIHDMMREVSIQSATEENLLLVLDEHGTLNIQDKIRHLVVNKEWSRDKKVFQGLNLSHTRSLTIFGEWRSFFISQRMKILRVLDLEEAFGLEDKDLKKICELRCLRYLGMRRTVIFQLPESLGRLQDLETLDIRETCVTKLPNSTVRLKKLQYLRASVQSQNEMSERYDATHDGTPSLVMVFVYFMLSCLFCTGVGKLSWVGLGSEDITKSQVAHLAFLVTKALVWGIDVRGVKVPKGIGKLKCLHTLGVVNIARGKGVLRNLRKLMQLRKLGVTAITQENSKEFCSTIAHLINLQSLFMRSEDERGLSGRLDDMSSPPKHLQSLKLFCYNLGKLPSWVQKLNNLVKMHLRSTGLKQEAIQLLKQLPSLTILHLKRSSFVGEELCFDGDGFLKLEVLQLKQIELKLVKFEENTLPKLELLQIKSCEKLNDEGCSGLQFLQSLKEVLFQSRDDRETLIKNLQDQVNENTNVKVKIG